MRYRTAVMYGGDEQLPASIAFPLTQDSLDVSRSRKWGKIKENK